MVTTPFGRRRLKYKVCDFQIPVFVSLWYTSMNRLNNVFFTLVLSKLTILLKTNFHVLMKLKSLIEFSKTFKKQHHFFNKKKTKKKTKTQLMFRQLQQYGLKLFFRFNRRREIENFGQSWPHFCISNGRWTNKLTGWRTIDSTNGHYRRPRVDWWIIFDSNEQRNGQRNTEQYGALMMNLSLPKNYNELSR